MLKFNNDAGLTASSVDEVREAVRAVFTEAFTVNGKPALNTSPETPQGQLIDSITAMLVQKDSELLHMANMFDPRKSEGVWQDALGMLYFLQRHPAVNSTAKVTCTGLSGTRIFKGAMIQSTADGTQWEAVSGGTIPDGGPAVLEFTCTTPGPVSAPPGTLDKIITTIDGWDTVNNEAAATVGMEAESQDAFEIRRYRSVALNSTSSIDSAYSRLASLDGVIAVCVRQNRTDTSMRIDKVTIRPHSVYVCVLGGKDEDIADALYKTVSAGCDYTGTVTVEYKDKLTLGKDTIRFNRPSESAMMVVVTVRRSDNLAPDAENTIKKIVFNNFYGTQAAQKYSVSPVSRVVMGDDLYASRFTGPLTAAGIHELIGVKVGYKDGGVAKLKDSMAIPINVAPSLSMDDIKVEWRAAHIPVEGTIMGFKGENPDVTGFAQAPFYHQEETGEDSGASLDTVTSDGGKAKE